MGGGAGTRSSPGRGTSHDRTHTLNTNQTITEQIVTTDETTEQHTGEESERRRGKREKKTSIRGTPSHLVSEDIHIFKSTKSISQYKLTTRKHIPESVSKLNEAHSNSSQLKEIIKSSPPIEPQNL